MWFDAFLRARSLSRRDLSDLRFFGVEGALVPSDDEIGSADALAVRRGWAETVGAVRRLRRGGLAGFAALGIHPRRIPARGLEGLMNELPRALGAPEVAALGEVGLLGASPLEERVFLRQLELARELRLPVLVALPGRGLERVARRTLGLLSEAGLEPGQALLAGADERMVRAVRACGHLAGLALSRGAGADAIDEAVRVVAALGPEGLVLGSDAGLSGGDLLALPRAADRLSRAGLSLAVVRRVCAANALGFLRVDRRRLPGRAPSGRSGRPASR
ncbi:MAG TPA: TatD family hydrolase [Anaeromyxobacter sp.]|nr:TatD family hydrolase [Anaeromyxobacter sp.]